MKTLRITRPEILDRAKTCGGEIEAANAVLVHTDA